MIFGLREKGQGMVEYALIIVFVAVVLILVVAFLGTQMSDLWYSKIVSALGAH